MNKTPIYGNFGSFIARMLVREENIQLILAWWSVMEAEKFAAELYGKNTPEYVKLDNNKNQRKFCKGLNPMW